MSTQTGDKLKEFSISAAGQRVLFLLKKQCAYRVRNAWRLRGSRAPIHQPTLDGLLANGLVERIETDRCPEIRITSAGRTFIGELRNGDRVKPPPLATNLAQCSDVGWLQPLAAVHIDASAHRTDTRAVAPV
jgi:hypothetical protein